MVHIDNGFVVHAGYSDKGTYDSWQLFYLTLVSLAVELVTDGICWWYENPRLDLAGGWNDFIDSTIQSKRYRQKVLPALLFSTLVAGAMMLYGFFKFPAEFTSDSCYFANNCIPYPCNPACFSRGGSINTGNNGTFTTVPFLQYACDAIASNKTAELVDTCKFDLTDGR